MRRARRALRQRQLHLRGWRLLFALRRTIAGVSAGALILSTAQEGEEDVMVVVAQEEEEEEEEVVVVVVGSLGGVRHAQTIAATR